MEPFGLFSLLQSLLPPQFQENASDTSAPDHTATQAQPPDSPHVDPPEPTSDNTAAFLSFMQSHKQRIEQIKRTKK